MPKVRVPGVGIVNVPPGGEAAFNHFMQSRDPDRKIDELNHNIQMLTKAFEGSVVELNQSTVNAMKEVTESVKKLKLTSTVTVPEVKIPEIKIPAPVVNVPKQEVPATTVEVRAEEQPKASKIKVSGVQRDMNSRISGCDIEVVEWRKAGAS